MFFSNKMNIAVFSNVIGGHHLEYLHHVYEMAEEDTGNNYYFILPDNFIDTKGVFDWRNLNNVEFRFFENDLDKPTDSFFSQCMNSYRICLLLKRYLKLFKCDVLYVNTIMYLLPFAPFLLGFQKCRIMGVIYKIYLYDDDNTLSINNVINILKYTLLSKSSLFSKILILNDSESAIELNKLYSTSKFLPIPDPFVKLPALNASAFREKYDIGEDKVVFAHIGALSINKSTIEILTSLRFLDVDARKRYVFVFAGIVSDEIKEVFYHLVDELKSSIHIIVEDRFCTYEEIASFCLGSNTLLIPYKRTSQSSGIIGYASQFSCPVIATSKGLLGKLVKQYKLGILIDEVTTENLIDAYRRVENNDYEKPSAKYCDEHSSELFKGVIKSCIYQIANSR